MKKQLILRLQGPLMAFGTTMIDAHGPTLPFPTTSMIVGLIANALGLDHSEDELLNRLQERIEIASRQDVPGKVMVDYQTVDLSLPRIRQAWTTYGQVETHGGSVADGTHQRYRQFIMDGVITVALSLSQKIEPDDPTVDQIEKAFLKPARPLFLGRKPCVPSRPLLLGVMEEENVLVALTRVPFSERCRAADMLLSAQWPAHLGKDIPSRCVSLAEGKDWTNHVHIGRRTVRQGLITVRPAWGFFKRHVRKNVA